MESLVAMVLVLWVLVFFSGPLAVLCDYYRRPLAAGVLAVIALWLGLFWFAHVTTAARYLGLCSTALGLYVVWRTASKI